MKIGIITFTYGLNCGQRLQNYAVQEIFQQFADEVITFKQRNDNALSLRVKVQLQLISRYGLRCYFARINCFRHFDSKIVFSKQRIGRNRIPDDINTFDYFIAGSDQIWSPYSHDVNENMFLTFAPQEKRIAFAPSMACESIPAAAVSKYKDYLSGFSNISVREQSSARIVKELIGIDPVVLVDPTLYFGANMWEEHEQAPNEAPNSDFVFLYFLGVNTIKDTIASFAESNGYSLVDYSDKQMSECGPEEFLWLIHHAKFIFTDSYHGTIFSIIFGKEFILCKRSGSSLNMNSRFDSLLSALNIEKRDYDSWMDGSLLPIDYIQVYSNIDRQRIITNDYVRNAINVK